MTRAQVEQLIRVYGRDAKLCDVLAAMEKLCPVCAGTRRESYLDFGKQKQTVPIWLVRKCTHCSGVKA